MSRQTDFKAIRLGLQAHTRIASNTVILAQGDSCHLLDCIPDQSISLILTDPPYHSTKKDNIYGDTHFAEDDHYLDWMKSYIPKWKRVLKPNGSLFCFCASEMAARLEVSLASSFNILSQIVWSKPNDPGFDGWKGKMKKEALRQWYPHSERAVFCEPAMAGNLHRSPFGIFLREMRLKAGLSGHQLTELTGAYGRVNHGGAVSNWETGRNIPSREQYSKICEVIAATGNVKPMPPYEDVIRPFFMDGKQEFTDVWNFPSVRPYKNKHPAEKPAELLEHVIKATTYPGDIILDCFAGSGSTAIAARKLDRRSVVMEIDDKWVEQVAARLNLADAHNVQGKALSQQKKPAADYALPLFARSK